MNQSPSIAHSRDNTVKFFTSYVETNSNNLVGKTVVDLSAGSGYIAHLFEKAGAVVCPFDLFPEQNQFTKVKSQNIDLQKAFPIESQSVDVAICAETIEHLPNQLFLFQETARILKPNGKFILTTPNTSSLRSRFAQFMMESEHYSVPAPNELDASVDWGNGDRYFGKLFLSGVLRLRTLAALNSLQIYKMHKSQSSSTSILMLVFYPIILFFNRKVKRKQIKNDPANQRIYQEIFSLNTSINVLLSKHLILEFVKH